MGYVMSEICICVDAVNIDTMYHWFSDRVVESSGSTRSSSSEVGYVELSMAQAVGGASMYVGDEQAGCMLSSKLPMWLE